MMFHASSLVASLGAPAAATAGFATTAHTFGAAVASANEQPYLPLKLIYNLNQNVSGGNPWPVLDTTMQSGSYLDAPPDKLPSSDALMKIGWSVDLLAQDDLFGHACWMDGQLTQDHWITVSMQGASLQISHPTSTVVNIVDYCVGAHQNASYPGYNMCNWGIFELTLAKRTDSAAHLVELVASSTAPVRLKLGDGKCPGIGTSRHN